MAIVKETRNLRSAKDGVATGVIANAGANATILDSDGPWLRIRLDDEADKPVGWVSSDAIDQAPAVSSGALDKALFALACVSKTDNGPMAHCVMAIAELRTRITDGLTANGDHGPFALSPAEWASYNSWDSIPFSFDANRIDNWRLQVQSFAAVCDVLRERLVTNGEQPRAVDLCLATMIGTTATLTALKSGTKTIDDIVAAVPAADLQAEGIDAARIKLRYGSLLQGATAADAITALATAFATALDAAKPFILQINVQETAKSDQPVPDPAKPTADPGTVPAPGGGDVSGKIAWGKSVTPEFKAKVISIAANLKCDPNFLMAAMSFESNLSPVAHNASGATGLIQFMPKTAISLGTTVDALIAMSAVDQLTFVEKYLKPQSGKMQTLSDLYMAILWPNAIGQPETTVLFRQGTKAYEQNRGLDTDNDGTVTKLEAAAKVQAKLNLGLQPAHFG